MEVKIAQVVFSSLLKTKPATGPSEGSARQVISSQSCKSHLSWWYILSFCIHLLNLKIVYSFDYGKKTSKSPDYKHQNSESAILK